MTETPSGIKETLVLCSVERLIFVLQHAKNTYGVKWSWHMNKDFNSGLGRTEPSSPFF